MATYESFTLAVCAEMVFRDLPITERVARIHALGFQVEMLENLNTAVDHPGVPFGRAADCLALVRAVDRPELRLMLDLYHAQIGEGNLIDLLRRALPYIGEIQVADVPGRCEPGSGEINYPTIARELQRLGYTGTIGLEGWASGDDTIALQRFRAAFTVAAETSSLLQDIFA